MKTNHNIHFHYVYRDAGNYKFRGSVVFSNPNRLLLEEALARLKAALIDEQYFIPSVCAIPIVHTAPYDPEMDHEWYELEK